MSAISEYLEAFRTAEYGEDVRAALIGAITECYENVNSPALLMTGISAIIANLVANGTIEGAVLDAIGMITEPTNNLFDAFHLSSGLLSTTGTLTDDDDYVTTAYIPVISGKTYYFTDVYRRVFYNSSKVFSSYADNPSTFTPSANGYIRVSAELADRDTAKINEGSSKDYQPGRTAIDYVLRGDVYRKSEVYNKTESYSKSETYNKSEVYSKSEAYSKSEVYQKSETYSDDEIDALLAAIDITLTTEQIETIIGFLD